MKNKEHIIKFIDLFAGIGGIRKGFEIACQNKGIQCQCVLTSEIKPHAIEILKQNHPDEDILGDIKEINTDDIPDFDILLAGFPCQAFSSAGKRLGFADTRGTLFFEVERILKYKRPFGFILENVEGLVTHDRKNKNDKIGNTLSTILKHLENLGYKTTWKVLNSKYFSVAQERKRIYIVGTLLDAPNLNAFNISTKKIEDILDKGLPTTKSKITDLLLKHYSINELYGKSIKDKRGGSNNIHSWDIGLKGKVSKTQKKLLNSILTQRRKKHWAEEFGIDWMDGMPLTYEQISTFFPDANLLNMLEDLVKKGYLKKEHPKKKVNKVRIQDISLPLGYNIVAGKMSYEISKILSPNEVAPTLVAMDMHNLHVIDNGGLRQLTLRETLRLFGYPEDFKFSIDKISGYDLLGNTVVVPVITEVAGRILNIYIKENVNENYKPRII